MGYYLLDNKNKNGNHFYSRRNKKLVGIVVHCTAGLEDKDMIGPDHSAENTARYAATTDRSVSWHSGSDSDTVLELLPASYTGWHVKGYNSSTYGHEISKRYMSWSNEPDAWVNATLGLAATHLAEIALENGIPLRKITKTQLDKAIAAGNPSMGGFVGHLELDPSRRSDPGKDFPWGKFFDYMKGNKSIPAIRYGEFSTRVKEMQLLLLKLGYELPKFGADGDYGQEALGAVNRFKRDNKLAVTKNGIWGEKEKRIANAILDGKDDLPDLPGEPNLKKGNKNTAVKKMQKGLVKLGYKTPTDGVYSSETTSAVAEFKKEHPTSTSRSATWWRSTDWRALNRGLNKPRPDKLVVVASNDAVANGAAGAMAAALKLYHRVGSPLKGMEFYTVIYVGKAAEDKELRAKYEAQGQETSREISGGSVRSLWNRCGHRARDGRESFDILYKRPRYWR